MPRSSSWLIFLVRCALFPSAPFSGETKARGNCLFTDDRNMRRTTVILTLAGALLLVFVFLQHSRPGALPSSADAELTSRDVAKEGPLPAARLVSEAAAPPPAEMQPTTNCLLRLYRGEEVPPLRPEQVAAYLEANHRGVESLLGAYRTTRDKALLQEAAEKYPNDPRVAFEAAFFGAPEDRRKWLDAFKNSAPDNSLPDYLAASDYFKAGDKAHALEALQSAAAKPDCQDYFADFVQNATEAYRSAGYSEAEAKTLAASQALLPHLASLKQDGVGLVQLAQSYRDAGDSASAQATLNLALELGARLNQPDSPTLIQMLVGIAVEKMALGAAEPGTPYGSGGQTAQRMLDALNRQREALKALTKPLDEAMLTRMPEADLVSYRDRQLLFGAQSAIQWVLNKYPPAGSTAQ